MLEYLLICILLCPLVFISMLIGGLFLVSIVISIFYYKIQEVEKDGEKH